MRIAIYSRHGRHATALALEAGFEALGHGVAHRSHSDYTAGQTEKFDAIVAVGLRGKGRDILADYMRIGTPVLIVDFGYVRRVTGFESSFDGLYWQISLGGLNRVPPFPCPPDRWQALGVELAPPVNRDGPRVLCAQTVGDAAHPFATRALLDEWIAAVPHDELRLHPETARHDGVDLEPLDAMLGRAGVVVTWNSNVGHDALIAGVPVVALGDAPYAGVALEDRDAYFARLAYGQWTIEEMAAGLPQCFIVDHLLPGVPPVFDAAVPEPAAEPLPEVIAEPEVVEAPVAVEERVVKSKRRK